MKNFVSVMALLLCVSACLFGCDRSEKEIAARRQQVEQTLLPVFSMQGQPLASMPLAQRMTDYQIPGVSIAVINGGALEWAQSYGVTDAISRKPVTPETRFQAASISKLVTAVAVMSLVQDGKIGLDDDVNHRLQPWKIPMNELTKTQPVTLRRLLSHSAGVNVPNFLGYAADALLPNALQILNGWPPAKNPAVTVEVAPGRIWQYSDGGYLITQQLLEDLDGQPFAELARQRVFDKIGMTRSTFAQPLPADLAESAASGHRVDGMPVEKGWYVYPEAAAEGLWTTPTDLAQLMIALQQANAGKSGKLLSADMAKSLFTPQIGNSAFVGPIKGAGDAAWFSAGGSTAGFRCLMVVFLNTGQGAVVMTNSENGHFLAMEIMRGIAQVYHWPDFRTVEKTAVSLSAERYSAYAGQYEFFEPAGMSLQVSAGDGRIHVTLSNQAFELFPENETTFFEPLSGMTITFMPHDDGQIKGLLFTPPLSPQPWVARKL